MEHWKKSSLCLLIIGFFILSGCDKDTTEKLLLIEGNDFVHIKSKNYDKSDYVRHFYIGKYEVTQQEWMELMDYNPSQFKGQNLPVEMVSWYDCVVFCNRKSIAEGFTPFYNIDSFKVDVVNQNPYDSLKWTVTFNEDANGYRLPTEAEWQYAADAGDIMQSLMFSGSSTIDEVGWYWRNSGTSLLEGDWSWESVMKNRGRTHPVGLKKANAFGLYDMSGNVREWCNDWYESSEFGIGFFRVQRGGGWMGGKHACMTSDRGKFEPNGKGPDQGFRLCRTAREIR